VRNATQRPPRRVPGPGPIRGIGLVLKVEKDRGVGRKNEKAVQAGSHTYLEASMEMNLKYMEDSECVNVDKYTELLDKVAAE
jgi:hypothetical protein